MMPDTPHLEYSYRIALVVGVTSLISQRAMTGLLQRANAYPHLQIRRFFQEALIKHGPDQLTDWLPDAAVFFCGHLPLFQNVRNALPQIPLIATSTTIPLYLIDAMCTGNTEEILNLALKHFCENGLENFGLFYAGHAERPTFLDTIFERYMRDRPGTFSDFYKGIHIEKLLAAPTGELLEQTGAWLQNLPKPVGIFAPTNHSAAYLIRVCKHFGLAVPGEIQVIGTDELDEALESFPHITSIHFPAERIGAVALKTVLNLLHGHELESKIIRMEGSSLVPRGSTGIIPALLSNIPAAIAYIESHATLGITVNEVLHQTQNVSRRTFYRDFTKETGELPARYIKRIQHKAACHLLTTTRLEITRISELTGHSSSNYFAQTFRRETGMSPVQYRNSHS